MDEQGLTKIKDQLKPTVESLITDQTGYDPFEDNAYLEQGTYLLARFSEAKKTVEDQRIAFTKPLNESLRAINRFFKNFSDPIEQADRELRSKLTDHRKKIEEQRLEDQIKAIEEDKPELPDLKKKIGGVVVKKVWTFKVVKVGLVPIQYLEVNEVKIRASIRSGIREIPGVLIFQEDQVSL